jgi:hypothetical protein
MKNSSSEFFGSQENKTRLFSTTQLKFSHDNLFKSKPDFSNLKSKKVKVKQFQDSKNLVDCKSSSQNNQTPELIPKINVNNPKINLDPMEKTPTIKENKIIFNKKQFNLKLNLKNSPIHPQNYCYTEQSKSKFISSRNMVNESKKTNVINYSYSELAKQLKTKIGSKNPNKNCFSYQEPQNNFSGTALETNYSVESTNLSNRINLNSLAQTKTTKETISMTSLRKNKTQIKLKNIKQVENPEEIHYLYVELNKQNKKLAFKFEKTSVIEENSSNDLIII